MQYCENFNALAMNEKSEEILLARLGCGQWTCEYCARKLRNQWRARIINAINNLGGNWSWFTLTAHSKKRGAVKSIENLRGAWDTLMKRMKRKYGQFEYIRVYEQHKDGSFHIHAIANFHFDDIKKRKPKNGKNVNYSKWLAKTAKDLLIGYYTHADNIPETAHGGYVASYVTKYMTKMAGEFIDYLGRVRRIQPSQGFPKLPKNGEKWQFKAHWDIDNAIAAQNAGKRVIDVSTGEVIGASYFTENVFIYPENMNEDYLTWKYRDRMF